MTEAEPAPTLTPVRFPVRAKLALAAAALVLVAGGLPATYTILHARQRARARVDAQLEQLGSTIATGGLFADGEGGVDPAALRAFVQNAPVLRLPLAYVVFLDESGRVDLGRSGVSPENLATIDVGLSERWLRGEEREVLEVLEDQLPRAGLRSLSLRIRSAEGREMGRLRIGMSTVESDRAAAAALTYSGAIVGAILLGSLLLAVLLSGPLVRPLRRLADAMSRVAEGDLDHAVAVAPRRDEIGRLEAAFNVMITGLRQRERLRTTLGRYVSDAVARRILSEAHDTDLTGEVRRVAVLFLDMRDFSALAESMHPRQVVELINAYFEIIVAAVGRHEGVINKFIGDAVMAVWGAPAHCDELEWRAVSAAWDIQRALGELNWHRLQDGLPVISVGIGINTGPAIAGNVGAAERLEYTVIGHEVNMAQRYESVARPGQILISTSTQAALGDRISARRMDGVKVKGRREPVVLFEVVALAPEDAGREQAR